MKTYKARCIYGYNEVHKRVTVDKKLKYCPNGQCGVRIVKAYTDGSGFITYETHLISYDSTVLIYNEDTNQLIIDGEQITAYATYSATTRKHVAAFLEEYVPSITYRDIKVALARHECVIEC